MHYRLLDLATFTIRANSLIVGSVLLTFSLNFDGSYVDADLLFVVFIFDTTYSITTPRGVSTFEAVT
jgi:hypothetical protein